MRQHCHYHNKNEWTQAIRIMKLTLSILFLFCVAAFGKTYSQQVTISAKNESLVNVIKQMRQQSDYAFVFRADQLKKSVPVNVLLRSVSMEEALREIFKNQPLEYEISEKTIYIKEKPVTKTNTTTQLPAQEQQQDPIRGRVTDEDGEPLAGTTIRIKDTDITYVTDRNGYFEIPYTYRDATLQVDYIGYKRIEITAHQASNIRLVADQSEIDNINIVVNTGYQSLPKERATGSFVQLDNEMINRRVSTNILDRLEGITSGMVFNKNQLAGNEQTGITIRGRSTLDLNVNADPLIIVDNFPFEGDLSSINPNDIENITVLKDAAAASIWGSRAGNGVIVMTTKKANYNQPLCINFNANTSVGGRPDLYYSRGFISAPEYIEAEKTLFDNGYFNSSINNVTSRPALSPVVEILLAQRNNEITESEAESKLSELKSIDARQDISRYFYRNSINQQYALNIRGGTANSNYRVSGGYDNNKTNLVKNDLERFTLNTTGNFILLPNLTLSTGMNFYQSRLNNNSQGLDYGSITGGSYGIIYPYSQLVDHQGQSMDVTQALSNSYLNEREILGFLDWRYRPYDELGFADNTSTVNNLIFRSTLNYKFLSHFNASLQYQWENQKRNSRDHQSIETFYTRNLINRYTQYNSATEAFTYPIPLGGILDLINHDLISENWRGQLNYEQSFSDKHDINALGGFEVREIETENFARRSYGYNEEYGTAVANLNYNQLYPYNPNGNQRIAAPPATVGGTINRFISYYGNAAYTYDNRYTFSASARRDGANIFGVRTNEKITPLWSVGGVWQMNNEDFYNIDFLPLLRLRSTFGYNGNVYNASAFLTATYRNSFFTGERMATITSPPNPDLRWEQV